MQRLIYFFLGVILTVAAFQTQRIWAQTPTPTATPQTYKQRAGNFAVAMAYPKDNSVTQRLAIFQEAADYFSNTRPPGGYAAFQTSALFAANYCVRSMTARQEAEREGRSDIFSSTVLLELEDNCQFAVRDALVLWYQSNGM